MSKIVFQHPQSLKRNIFHYCPGCGHSIVHRITCEVIDEMGIRGITIGVPPAGCAVLAYNYFDVDMIEAPHGRGPAMASGIKRSLPDRIVFSYQGDGDLAAIGMAESFHAANRGENITVIFINNAVYGMTGGQMAPTTMLNQKTTTSPAGRQQRLDGYLPLHPRCDQAFVEDAFVCGMLVDQINPLRTFGDNDHRRRLADDTQWRKCGRGGGSRCPWFCETRSGPFRRRK